jgi:putative peptide zinc metalloprotease protein
VGLDRHDPFLVMTAQSENRSVREIDGLRPRLRDGLRFSIQEHGGRRVCVIEDRAASRFHRVGLEEYRFLRSLDGTRTVATLLASLARGGGGEAWSEGEAAQMLRWARDQHLLALESDRAASSREHTEQALRAAVTWLNPLTVKIPLGRPDPFFNRAAALLRPALGWAGLGIWIVTLLVGGASLAPEWGRFAADTGGLLARDNWLWLFVAWAGLKVAHEFGHGVVCRHFGAAVREVGAIFVLFVPMGYVDATACIGLASKWRRIGVAAAGMMVEFFLAAVAAIVWAHSEPGTLRTVAHDVVITGTVVTLFFNANPLMRFDGYFILSDLIELQNLATRGRQWVQRLWMGVLLGGSAWRGVRPRGREGWAVAAYGGMAWLWQVLVLAGLLLGASVLMRGGGLALAALAAVTWLAIPLTRFAAGLLSSASSAGGGWRVSMRMAAILVLLAGALAVPWRRTISSPGVVELADGMALRAECPGFVEKVCVADGATVEEGDLLLRLRNDEAAAQLARVRLQLQQQELRARLAYTREDIATFQAEQAKAEALRRSAAEQEAYLATLEIRAPFQGRVTNRDLARLRGVFFGAGQEVMRIGRATGADVKIAVSERDAAHFRTGLGEEVGVRVDGRGQPIRGTLIRMDAHATRQISQPALTAAAGGPIALRPTEEAGRSESGENDVTRGYELAEPHFAATVRLPADAPPLSPGETARVRFRSDRGVTLWAEMQGAVRRWLRRYSETAKS